MPTIEIIARKRTPAQQDKANAYLFSQSPDYDRVALCIVASYLLVSIANSYMEEASEILQKWGNLKMGLKHMFNQYEKAFTIYNVGCREMIASQDAKNIIIKEYESMDKVIRDFIEHSAEDHQRVAVQAPEEVFLTKWAGEDGAVSGYKKNIVGHTAVRYVKAEEEM